MSAEILVLSDYRADEAPDDEIDLATVVHVAVRDLREILSCWGSEVARQRAQECELMMSRAVAGLIDDPSEVQS